MVLRSGFYVEDKKLCRKDVAIEWNLGFDKEAKREYIKRLHQALGGEMSPCIDVTTASPIREARSLSPYYVKVGDRNLEDAWKDLKATHLNDIYLAGAFDYLYLNSLTDEQLGYVMQVKCFTDVFFNPETGHNTQAKSLAVYQLLVRTHQTSLLHDLNGFVNWYVGNCFKVKAS